MNDANSECASLIDVFPQSVNDHYCAGWWWGHSIEQVTWGMAITLLKL
ncbi:MAG: hypothetical protein KDB23_27060 [Planctomycetales bacterium]|nr:hypothetical protein [Planctomycetales bacterium]